MEERGLIALHDVFDHLCCRDPGEVAATRGHGKRERKADEIVGRVADDGLVEVANFDFDAAVGVGYGAEIADVAVPADPDGRSLGMATFFAAGKPLVKLNRVAAHIGVDAARHLATALLLEDA